MAKSSKAEVNPPSLSTEGCRPLVNSRSSRTAMRLSTTPVARAAPGIAVEQRGLLLGRQRQQPLLGAVMQGAFDPAALVELGGGDPGTRGEHLFQLERYRRA
ncbi:hypothetical protein [Candidatus Frankia alpina]|uniref:hypothetical protein n=1 Tax=Candidatus Frankia alpina TaxID=2699483 RepID=UPI001F3CC414|nr:hypothetical protein [Candidatus Frankia alpina]